MQAKSVTSNTFFKVNNGEYLKINCDAYFSTLENLKSWKSIFFNNKIK